MRGYCAAPCHFRDDFNHTPWRQFAQWGSVDIVDT
jgi:hypothetical protein